MATILNSDKQYHINVSTGDVGEYVILCGDPGRVPKIAEHFENAKQMSYNREYNVYIGYLDGVKVSAVSTGIGGPSSAIAVEELIKCNCHTFIRVGTSGGMKIDVGGGDLVIANAAIRSEGTSKEYLPYEYPAVSDFEVTSALKNAAQKLCSGKEYDKYHIGVVHSKDSFYGETNPEDMPVDYMLKNKWDAFVKAGCLTSEMECAAIFSVANSRKVRAGAVLSVLWNVERSKQGLADNINNSTEKAIKCAVMAIKELINNDKKISTL
ncbi:MAG: uridine phosphorylase [Clostridia bacterium]|nr:uridine phosphorylase [Clostridia bacterium]